MLAWCYCLLFIEAKQNGYGVFERTLRDTTSSQDTPPDNERSGRRHGCDMPNDVQISGNMYMTLQRL